MAPPSRSATAKAHKKRLSRGKGKAPSGNNDGPEVGSGEQRVGLPSLDAADTLVDFPVSSMRELQIASARQDQLQRSTGAPPDQSDSVVQAAGSGSKPKYTAEQLANPPIPPKNAEERELLKAAVAERARLNGDVRMTSMLNPRNPSQTLRVLPYTPITPPGVAWRKAGDRVIQSKKQKRREIRELLKDSEKLAHLYPDSDSEDEDEKEPTEDRTIHAPIAHRLRSQKDFHSLREKFEVMFGALKGRKAIPSLSVTHCLIGLYFAPQRTKFSCRMPTFYMDKFPQRTWQDIRGHPTNIQLGFSRIGTARSRMTEFAKWKK